MPCKHKTTLLFLTIFLFLTLPSVFASPTYYLPKDTMIRNGLKVHFGNNWISTSETDALITAWFLNGWTNYTVYGTGIQQVYNGSKPNSVYLNGINMTEGDGWTYSTEIVTLTGATSTASLLWGIPAIPHPPPILLPPTGSTYYFRSDSKTTNNATAYYLHTSQSSTATTLQDTSSSALTAYYSFTIQILHATTSLTTLADKIGTITMTSNYTGYLTGYWNCSERNLAIDDAFKITIYSKLGSGSWVAKASYVSDQLLSRKLLATTWVFYLKVSYTSGSTTVSFSFGNSNANSRIERIYLKPALYSEIVMWYLINGNLLGALLYGYLQLFGVLFYGLVLFGVCASLYVAYRKIAPVAFLFILFGGSGGIVWALVPSPASIICYIFLLMALAVLIFRVIR